eukprot:4776176-Amphidinium_carterae.1
MMPKKNALAWRPPTSILVTTSSKFCPHLAPCSFSSNNPEAGYRPGERQFMPYSRNRNYYM